MVVNIYDGSDDMIIGITVICCMLLFCLLVGTVYFSKSKIKSTENKLYSRLVIITMIGLVTELLCFYFVAPVWLISFLPADAAEIIATSDASILRLPSTFAATFCAVVNSPVY